VAGFLVLARGIITLPSSMIGRYAYDYYESSASLSDIQALKAIAVTFVCLVYNSCCVVVTAFRVRLVPV
jgi:hypothetical protein